MMKKWHTRVWGRRWSMSGV
jgi:hypothetical protein